MTKRDDNFSVNVSNTLNASGYKWHMIEQRRGFAQNVGYGLNNGLLYKSGYTSIPAGSRREGICKFLGGDSDSMHIYDEVISAENVRQFESRGDLSILELDVSECPPGYALLKLVKHGGRIGLNIVDDDRRRSHLQKELDRCCRFSDAGVPYISSEIFIQIKAKKSQIGHYILKECIVPDSLMVNMHTQQSRSGPSIPSTNDMGNVQISHDNVYAFTCHCPSIFETFRNRPRKHGWPPEHILQDLSQLEAHVVPVGCKRSPRHFLEWRICFTKAEIRLIEFLAEPQIMVFVLLKIFAKDFLKNAWDGITSYIMKNVILWMAELTPSETFRLDTIVERFINCLFFMKICIQAGRLPNYMIPDRNLLSHDTLIMKREKLLSTLDDCLYEKGFCLLKSRTLNDALVQMYRSPEATLQDGLDKDQAEIVMMSVMSRILPEYNVTTSYQDLRQFVVSGKASELRRLMFLSIKPEDFARDPIGSMKRCMDKLPQLLQ